MSDVMTEDIQRLILDKVSSPRDHARFSCVCKLWYSIYKERTFPWFVLADHDNESHTCGFFSEYDQKIYRFSAPQLEEKLICGSSHGWLVTFDNEYVFGLYDPFSKSFIQLPLSPFKKQYVMESNGLLVHKVILSCNPHTNPNECIIMLLDYMDNLAYCKIGDTSWTPISTISTVTDGELNYFDDLISYEGNFVVFYDSQVYTCHIDPEPHLTPFGPKMSVKPHYIYLMNLEGDVVILDKYYPNIVTENEDANIIENQFDVYKLDKDMKSWKKENEVGERILFLGLNESISLSTCLVPNSIANTIYDDKGIYHLKRKKGIPVYPRDVVDHLKSSRPLWLIQN